MIGEQAFKYREKVTVVVEGRKHEFTFNSENKEKSNSPTTEFWHELREEFFMPTGADLQPLYRLIGYDTAGVKGGETTELTLQTSYTSTSMRLTVGASVLWNSSNPLSRIVLNCRHRVTGAEYPYFDVTLPSHVQASPGSTVSVTYEVEIYVARVSNAGALVGYTLSMTGLFSHVPDKLTGRSTSKVYIHRAVLSNQYRTQTLTVPLDLDLATNRAYKYNFVSNVRVDPVYFVEVQGITPAGTLVTLMTYTPETLANVFSIVENQPLSIDIRISTPA
ncbi:MAG: hypothetical protein QXQ90_10065 [Desulfurococcaceae archaeon]